MMFNLELYSQTVLPERLSLHTETYQHTSKDLGIHRCPVFLHWSTLHPKQVYKVLPQLICSDCRVNQSVTNKTALLQNHAMLWTSYASRFLWTWPAQAHQVVSVFLNKAKWAGFANHLIVFFFDEDSFLHQLVSRQSKAERCKLWKMYHRAASYVQRLNASSILLLCAIIK